MGDTLKKMRKANSELWRLPVNDSDKVRIEEVETSLLQSRAVLLDGLALGELEERLNSILSSYGIADSWELSAGLAKCNMPPDTLISLLTNLDSRTARPALARIAAFAELSILLGAVENSSDRISNLVRTVKEYTYMDQRRCKIFDVARNLETTLGTLAHILRRGIEVKRNYEPVPVLVSAVGTESESGLDQPDRKCH